MSRVPEDHHDDLDSAHEQQDMLNSIATSKNELRAWYSYSWSYDVFPLCAMGIFIPIFLEQLARENSQSEDGRSCRDLPSYVSCTVRVLWFQIQPVSFALYTASLSVLFQALFIISMSGLADHGSYRKRLLLGFGWCGGAATLLFLLANINFYFGPLLAIVGNVSFGVSSVCLNAFLVILVANLEGGAHDMPPSTYSAASNIIIGPVTLGSEQAPDIASEATLKVSSNISGKGTAAGFGGAIVLQLILIPIVAALGSTRFSTQVAISVCGLWWLVFSIPTVRWLKNRPGRALDLERETTIFRYVLSSWIELRNTARDAKSMYDVVIFLSAWFLLSDAMTTINSCAVLFGKSELDMSASALAVAGVLVTLSGVTGAYAWPSIIAKRVALSQVGIALLILASALLVPLYVLCGFLPFLQQWGLGGVQTVGELYFVSITYGFILGGMSTYFRSIFGVLVPPGRESAFFALYAVTDKGSSVVGPAVVGAITDATGNIRYAFYFPASMLLLAFFILRKVDTERGRINAIRISRSMTSTG